MGRLWRTTSSGKRVRTKAGYEHEYATYQSSSKAKAERAARNSARRAALKKGTVHKGDGTSIDHKDSNPLNNSSSNLRVMSRTANAGRRENSRLKGSKRKKRGSKNGRR